MPVQGDLKITNAEFNSTKSFFGRAVYTKIGDYKCQKFIINLKMEYMLNKKSK
jgi:hypothetical protein